jgi:hypothetical protein
MRRYGRKQKVNKMHDEYMRAKFSGYVVEVGHACQAKDQIWNRRGDLAKSQERLAVQ